MTAVDTEFVVEKPPRDSPRDSKNRWLIWQIADSAFPIGGFVHSGGLEAAWQHGEIRTRLDLEAFLKNQITQYGHGALPFVSHAHLQPCRLPEFDGIFNAFTTNHIANRASRLQGNAFLTAVERVFGARAKTTYGHFAPVYGAVLALLGIDRHTSARLFLFGQFRSTVSSAVRLGIIGPLEAQAIQNVLSSHAERIFQRAAMLDLDDIAQTAPLADLWQGAHDRLYSRLFQS